MLPDSEREPGNRCRSGAPLEEIAPIMFQNQIGPNWHWQLGNFFKSNGMEWNGMEWNVQNCIFVFLY